MLIVQKMEEGKKILSVQLFQYMKLSNQSLNYLLTWLRGHQVCDIFKLYKTFFYIIYKYRYRYMWKKIMGIIV